MKLNQRYVVKCIKGNNDRCGFGYRYKVDQYVTYNGRPTNVLDEAHVYRYLDINQQDSFPEYSGCFVDDGLPGDPDCDWKVYFELVPVSVRISRVMFASAVEDSLKSTA